MDIRIEREDYVFPEMTVEVACIGSASKSAN
jgi:hypothetical protein